MKNKIKYILGIFILLFAVKLSYDIHCYKKNKDIIELYGNIDIRDVNLGFRVSGRLSKVNVDEGDYVKNGDILAKLDTDIYEIKLKAAKADYALALSNFNNKKATFNRISTLFKKNIKSKQDYEDSLNSFNVQKARLEAALQGLKIAQTNLSDCVLKAPSDGVIVSRIFEKGSILNSNNPVYSMLLMSKIYARGYIEEKFLGKVKIGDIASILTDSGTVFQAKISYISPVAEFTPKTIETKELRTDLVYRIHFLIEEHNKKLHKGMPVTIKIKL